MFVRSDNHAFGKIVPIFAKYTPYSIAEQIFPYLAHELDGDAKAMQSQPRIGDGSPCRQLSRPNVNQLAGCKQIPDSPMTLMSAWSIFVSAMNRGDDIQANMSGYDNIRICGASAAHASVPQSTTAVPPVRPDSKAAVNRQ
ncbi:hypothetical protein PAT3040_03525 [Paenibacillus agaridevorans]|uniref:Uncharacterized protein n=1 Tax=Paenibacillus agaridevorans TaxID=171404 RepID=A0A2R5EQF0_9BACL|nr:hypothetical protein PAT3040_03525 [Paenibacillus agaridevorans]